MNNMPKQSLNIIESLPADVTAISHLKFTDNRGFLNCLLENDRSEYFDGYSLKMSSSKKNVARGMHWQNMLAKQEKAITVLSGSILDVLINLDSNSEEFKQVYRFELDAKDGITLVIPPHYAHGFLALSEIVFLYFCKGKYSPANEVTIRMVEFISDKVASADLILSNKDLAAPTFEQIIYSHFSSQ
jgi:dTDP-4-dehydrorhamnose 3,5-epimerase